MILRLAFLLTCLSFFNIALADDFCIKEGGSTTAYPGAPECCSGLERQPPLPGEYGNAGVCRKVPKGDCTKEGDAVGVYPGASQCCDGLELTPPPPGEYGSAGICLKYLQPAPISVDDTRTQTKDQLMQKAYAPEKPRAVSK